MLLLQAEDTHPELCLSLRVRCCKVRWPVAYYMECLDSLQEQDLC